MKHFRVFLLVLIGAVIVGTTLQRVAARPAQASAADLRWGAFDYDGLVRTYAYYVPPGLGSDPAPLLVLLHGGGQSATKVWDGYTGPVWRDLADANGFILLLPEGRLEEGTADSHQWNDCRSGIVDDGADSQENDVGYIGALIDLALATGRVDASRLYVTGASNGGMMTLRLANETPARFDAYAAVIANQPVGDECAPPTEAVPLLIMNGTDDPLMPFEGGCVGAACNRGVVESTAATVTLWAGLYSFDAPTSSESLPNAAWFDGSTVRLDTFDNDATSGAELLYYQVDGGGHWMPTFGEVAWWEELLLGRKNRDISGPAEIWAFFSQHSAVGVGAAP